MLELNLSEQQTGLAFTSSTKRPTNVANVRTFHLPRRTGLQTPLQPPEPRCG